MNATDETKRYNGWTNYETWNVKLWMDNEEGSYRYWRERVQELYNSEQEEHEITDAAAVEAVAENATILIAEALKDEHESAMQDMLESTKQSASMWADLLGAALSEVNWYEIAEAMMEEVEQVEPDASDDEE